MKRTASRNSVLRKKKLQETKVERKGPKLLNDESDRVSVSTMRVEEDFPRGGEDVVTPLERRSLHCQAQQDVLFGKSTVQQYEDDSDADGTPVPKKKRQSKSRMSFGLKDVDPGTNRREKYIPKLSLKSLTEGVLMLGAVREIHQYNLVVSLPDNLTGSVNIGNISDPLTEKAKRMAEKDQDEDLNTVDNSATDLIPNEGVSEDDALEPFLPDLSSLFHVGQLVICCVVSVNVQRKHIELSLNPRLVNAHLTGKTVLPNMVVCGYVSSIEDHGYLIDFCVTGKHGFLLKKHTYDYIKQNCGGRSLTVGQVINCQITSGASARAVPVTISSQAVESALLPSDSFLPLSSLLPGFLVNGAVTESVESGIVVGFLGGFEGAVHVNHLSGDKYSTKHFPVGKKVKARLLWVDVLNKKVGLSLQRLAITGLQQPFSEMEIGDIFHSAKVASVDSRQGIILDLGNGVFGYAPLRFLHDEKTDRVQKTHSVGSLHPCRVVQFNLIDGFAVVSLKESVLEKPFMKLSDIKPGLLTDGEVKRLTEKGVYIKLSDHFDGFCPNSELADNSYKKMRKKLSEGSLLKCRVLVVDLERSFVLLTCKKSLVKSDLPPLVSLEGVQPGDIHDGIVVFILPSGLLVRFYNKVKGFVPKSELILSSAQAFLDLNSAYRLGQALKCRVLSVSPEDKKLKLSLRLDESSEPHVQVLRAGDIVNLEVKGVTPSGITLCHSETQEMVYLPLEYLSDFSQYCHYLMNHHGKKLEQAVAASSPYFIEDVLIVNGGVSSQPTIGTTKKALINAVRRGLYPSDVSELRVGQVFPGAIKRTYSYGCFVQFPNNLTGLSPVRYLKDEFITDATGVFKDMSTVLAKVQDIDATKDRFILSLRPSDLRLSLSSSAEDTQTVLLERLQWLFKERDSILHSILQGSDEIEKTAMTSYRPGTITTATITAVKDGMVMLRLDNGLEAHAPVTTASSEDIEPDKEVSCCVTDFDFVSGVLMVSLNPKLVEGIYKEETEEEEEREETKSKKKKKRRSVIEKRKEKYERKTELQPGHNVTAIVEHVTPFYLVCTCSTLIGSQLTYGLFDSGQWGVFPPQLKFLKPGQACDGTVISSSSVFMGKERGLPVLMVSENKRSKFRGESLKQLDVSVGDIVDVKLKTILDTQMNVSYGIWTGRVHVSMATDNLEKGDNPFKSYSEGDTIRARLLRFRRTKLKSSSHSAVKPSTVTLELSTKPSLLDPSVPLSGERIKDLLNQDFSEGDKVVAAVREISSSGVELSLSPYVDVVVPPLLAIPRKSLTSSIMKTDLGIKRKLHSLFRPGQIVECVVTGKRPGKPNKQHSVSLIGSVPPLVPGGTVHGVVSKIDPHHCAYFTLPHPLPGVLDITDVSDHFIPNPFKHFTRGRFIKFHILAIEENKVVLSLRRSHLGKAFSLLPELPEDTKPDKEISSVCDLTEGEVIRGYVKAVGNAGVFVRLGRDVTGRVMITNISDRFIKNYQSVVSSGELVRVKVIGVDKEDSKVELSLKLSDIDPENNPVKPHPQRKRKRNNKSEAKRGNSYDSSLNSGSEDEEGDHRELEMALKKAKLVESEDEDVPVLPVTGGFDWGEQRASTATGENEDCSEEHEAGKQSNKKTRRQKKAMKNAEEAFLYNKEFELLESSKIPETPDDFDRMLAINPNSSALWLQYMAYFLHLADVEKARGIARKALSTISFREEQEKLNVWCGLLNLENLYGTQEALMATFQEALQQNEQLPLYYKLAGMYQMTDKMDLAEQVYQTMTKKFSDDSQVWIKYGLFQMQRGRMDAARNLMKRSLKSLSKQQQVMVISKFAQCEFKYGDPERARTMFENLLSSYPRRIDLWSVYIDAMVKTGDIDKVREIFERAINLKVSVKKIKFLFKKYLQFEESYGTPSTVKSIKDKARAYVETKAVTV